MNDDYMEEWKAVQQFCGEENDGMALMRWTEKSIETVSVNLGLFIWLANNIQKLTCPECKSLKPDDDFLRDKGKCRDCSF